LQPLLTHHSSFGKILTQPSEELAFFFVLNQYPPRKGSASTQIMPRTPATAYTTASDSSASESHFRYRPLSHGHTFLIIEKFVWQGHRFICPTVV